MSCQVVARLPVLAMPGTSLRKCTVYESLDGWLSRGAGEQTAGARGEVGGWMSG